MQVRFRQRRLMQSDLMRLAQGENRFAHYLSIQERFETGACIRGHSFSWLLSRCQEQQSKAKLKADLLVSKLDFSRIPIKAAFRLRSKGFPARAG